MRSAEALPPDALPPTAVPSVIQEREITALQRGSEGGAEGAGDVM